MTEGGTGGEGAGFDVLEVKVEHGSEKRVLVVCVDRRKVSSPRDSGNDLVLKREYDKTDLVKSEVSDKSKVDVQ